ncbi:uncharacterized protein LOC124124546 isoform X4 [Haliotis rufescens]|uniref:uncharacterized protein LOC124124546 isoform X4 n=1 Tax=Haliotis rufescens TaxID=6454 RepID=UPI00201F1D94|nr:uncharacterized protein LOC124124546 isoform X4 [Haliotis rufescens]
MHMHLKTQDGCVAPTQSPDTTYLTQLTTALIFSSLWNIVKGLLTRCHTTTALSPLAPTPKETVHYPDQHGCAATDMTSPHILLTQPPDTSF